MHFGPGYDGLATYLHAKQRYAERSWRLVHHAVVPADREFHFAGWHELRVSRRHLRPTDRQGTLPRLLQAMRPDVIVLHGPFEAAQPAISAARTTDAHILTATHHQEPPAPYSMTRAIEKWRVNRRETLALRGIEPPVAPLPASVPSKPRNAVRLGVDPEFATAPVGRRGSNVVFAGELGHGTSVPALLLAANAASTVWPILIIGHGPQTRSVKRAIRMLGLSHRVELRPFERDRAQLASICADAGCVVHPGNPHGCQLTVLEAAATGTPIVAPASARSTLWHQS